MSLRRFEDQTPRIADSAYVDSSAVVIGDVDLAEDASIWPRCVVRGDVNAIRIGARSNIQDGSVLHVSHDSPYLPGGAALVVGEEVTVGHQVTLHACTIGDRCLVGIGCIVLDRAVLEPEVMLGAGSLVPPGKTLAGGHLYLGRPARAVRPLTEREREHLGYSAAHYVRLKSRHLACARVSP